MQKELQLVDFINEFSKWWRVMKQMDNHPDKDKCFHITMEMLFYTSGDYDEDFLTEYFEGNYWDVIDVVEGKL